MKIVIIMIMTFLFVWIILLSFEILYYKIGIGKWFYHDICRKHVPDDDYTFDGCSIHSQCKYCEKELTQDDQGNWF